MELCVCGSKKNKNSCCLSIITGKEKAETAEELMRARYTAYTTGDIDFLETSLLPEKRNDFDKKATEGWSKGATWLGLEIVSTDKGGKKDTTGTVEFIANYIVGGSNQKHHEIAEFQKENGDWYFVDGKLQKALPVVRLEPKLGRNDPCSCGSGKKFKKCCGAA